MATVILLAAFGIFLLIGVPIAFSLGLSSLIYILFFMNDIPWATIAQQVYGGMNSFSLTAIPFFILLSGT